MEGFNTYIPITALFITLLTCNALHAVSIKKVFHHKNKNTHANIEAGSCVFYFDSLPKVMPLAEKTVENNKEVQKFFIPNITIPNECRQSLDQLNKDPDRTYTFTIDMIQKPQQGILISITYAPGTHAVECKQFEAITRDKGLVFYVYNQRVLDTLRTRKEPLMQTVLSGKHPPCIFIDSGHGGDDKGATGVNGIQEKHIALSVSSYLAQLLKKNGYNVILSRAQDMHVPLDKRTTDANYSHADIFISIHANAALNKHVHGIETFCLKPDLFTPVFSALSNQDNAIVHTLNIQKYKQSHTLASLVQRYVCDYSASYQNMPVNRGLKHSVAQVFFTQIPSILVELGFVTNPDECQLLSTVAYQKTLAQALSYAICQYFNQI